MTPPCEMCKVCDMSETDWLSVAEAADLLGVSQDTVRRHCDLGNLRCVRVLDGPRRVSAKSVAENMPDTEPAA